MERGARPLLISAAIAAAMAIAGFGASARLQANLDSAVATCKADKRPAFTDPKTGEQIGVGEMICDPIEYYSHMDDPWVSPQKEIRDAIRAKWSQPDWLFVVAVVVMAIGALPYAWYFLLLRLKEVREALTGAN